MSDMDTYTLYNIYIYAYIYIYIYMYVYIYTVRVHIVEGWKMSISGTLMAGPGLM